MSFSRLFDNENTTSGVNTRLAISDAVAGVPKHSDFEPDYLLVKGNGPPPQIAAQ